MKHNRIANAPGGSSTMNRLERDQMPDTESYVVGNKPPPMTSFSELFVRLTWMALGPIGLAVSSIVNASRGDGWFTGTDGAFLFFFVSMLTARWWEFHCGRALTADGLPAKPGDLKRYVLTMFMIALPVWVLTNVAGNLISSR